MTTYPEVDAGLLVNRSCQRFSIKQNVLSFLIDNNLFTTEQIGYKHKILTK